MLKNTAVVWIPSANPSCHFFRSNSSSLISVDSKGSDASLANNIQLRGLGDSDSPSVMMPRSFGKQECFSEDLEQLSHGRTKEAALKDMFSMVEIQSISHSPSEFDESDMSEPVVKPPELLAPQEMDIPIKIPFSFSRYLYYCFYMCCTRRLVSVDIAFEGEGTSPELVNEPQKLNGMITS